MRSCLKVSCNATYLTERDHAILAFIHRYDGCAVEHVHHRFWSSGSSPSACYRRISRLISAEYLAAARLPSSTGEGSGKYFLTLGTKGRTLLAELYDLPCSHIRSRRFTSPLLADHHFAMCSFRASIEAASDVIPTLSIVEWIAETELRRTPMCVTDVYVHMSREHRRTIPLVADAAFTLMYQGKHQSFLVEMDQATIPRTRIQTKLRGYLRWQQSQRSVCPVLYVVPTERRAAEILSLALAQGNELGIDARSICVSLQNQIGPAVLTRPIWHQPGVPGDVLLLPSSIAHQESA